MDDKSEPNDTADNAKQRPQRSVADRTKRHVGIEHEPTPDNLARSNPQTQSPLFSTIPAELRNQIFALALQQYDDPDTEQYGIDDLHYRPDHRARHIVSTTLLLTCRRIWLEANHLPMTQAVHAFWYGHRHRRPEWCLRDPDDIRGEEDDQGTEDGRFKAFIDSLGTLQLANLAHIRVFAQMFWLEQDFAGSQVRKQLHKFTPHLASFTLTIRHSDWWDWERDAPLRLQTKWLGKLLKATSMVNVTEIRLELETVEWKVGQLRPIVEEVKAVARRGKWWEVVEPVQETTWSGPVSLGGRVQKVYEGREELDYRVFTVRFRQSCVLREAAKVKERWQEEGSLLKLLDP